MPYPGEAAFAREPKSLPRNRPCRTPLIALLLLLGGANRPNEALRPHASRAGGDNERRGLAECASSAAAFGSVGVLVALAQSEHVGTDHPARQSLCPRRVALWVVLLRCVARSRACASR